MTLEPIGPNAEQVRYWNETAAPKWLEYQTILDAQLERLGGATMDRAGPGITPTCATTFESYTGSLPATSE